MEQLKSGFYVVLLVYSTLACDMHFESRKIGGGKNGTFQAPIFLNLEEHVRQCTYTFTAGENERVLVEFEEFDLNGTPPECYHEHLDLFTEIKDDETMELIQTPFGGRYCGKIPPRPRISMYNKLSFVFLTDRENVTEARFSGNFEFIPADKYTLGTPMPSVDQRGDVCSFIIYAKHKKHGEILTPTYPGSYPKNLQCQYKFIGEENQRLRLEFRDFDLFYGGAHCPFDYVTIYDGPNDLSEKIGTYCGQMRNLVIYSTKNIMYVTFTTLKRTALAQNRGFFGIFEFSESFVKLDFIQKDATHIRGTECDQKILSKKESSGMVFSPNYPFPYQTNVVCRYYIYGMQDEQNLERVILEFEKFNIPMQDKRSCHDGYLKVYTRGQEEEHQYNDHDYEFCGKSVPAEIRTLGPRLVLLFNAGTKPGSGFKARFHFETEYRIPMGTPAPDGSCKFTYRSLSRTEGRFNSPRHPANYPSSTNCTYLFLARPKEQVQIVFDSFKVRTDNLPGNSSLGAWRAYGRAQCVEDWVEIYQIYKDSSEELVGRYCSSSAPGPVVSLREISVGLKVFLVTDAKDVFSGFQGRYRFFKEKSVFGDECGGNVTNKENGVITSPNYPAKYTTSADGGNSQCHWFINVRPRHRILLNFEHFEVEGKPLDRGCPAATLRVWPWEAKDKTPLELCGDNLERNSQIMSESNVMRISFFIADKAVGANGFEAVWTEIRDEVHCSGFLCFSSNFCISESLKCNGIHNCGNNDKSDEIDCIKETEVNEFMVLGLGLGISSVVLIAVLLYCHRRRRRRAEHPMMPSHAHFHTCESIGERFATSSSMDSVRV